MHKCSHFLLRICAIGWYEGIVNSCPPFNVDRKDLESRVTEMVQVSAGMSATLRKWKQNNHENLCIGTDILNWI